MTKKMVVQGKAPEQTEGQKRVQLIIDQNTYERLFKIYWLMKEIGEFREENWLHLLLGAVLTSAETGMPVHMSDNPSSPEDVQRTKEALVEAGRLAEKEDGHA